MKRFKLPAVLAACIALISCSGNPAADDSERVLPADTPLYNLGYRTATTVLDTCPSQNSIREALLEVRSTEYDIRCRQGNSAANAYILGFKHSLRESGDTLYRTLFE